MAHLTGLFHVVAKRGHALRFLWTIRQGPQDHETFGHRLNRGLRSIQHVEAAAVMLRLAFVRERDRFVLIELIEGQRLALLVVLPRVSQSAALVTRLVEEDDAGAALGSGPQGIRLPPDDRIRHARAVRERHAQRAVLLDHVDALDVDLVETLSLNERQQNDAEGAEREGLSGGWGSH
jgi:hypothetical protein